jgi:hypothetical protein
VTRKELWLGKEALPDRFDGESGTHSAEGLPSTARRKVKQHEKDNVAIGGRLGSGIDDALAVGRAAFRQGARSNAYPHVYTYSSAGATLRLLPY